MKSVGSALIAAVLALGSGCARPDWIERTLVTVDVTGAWQNANGTWELDLTQEGAIVKGALRRFALGSFNAGSGEIEGTVAGDVLRWKQTSGLFANCGGEMTVSGDEMRGTASCSQMVFGSQTMMLQRVDSTGRPTTR